MVYELEVPYQLERAKCHLNWIRELLPFLETSGENKAASLTDYLKLLLKEEANNQIIEFGKMASSWGVGGSGEGSAAVDDDEDQTGDSCYTLFGFVGLKLNLVAFYTYLRDFKAARSHLDGVRKMFDGEVERTGSDQWEWARLKTIRYCFDAAEWAINLMEHFEITPASDSTSAKVPDDIAKESGALLRKWGNIRGRDSAMATISFFKGCLGAALKIKEEETLNSFKKAVELEPNYHVWYHYAYRKLRRIRRSDRKGNRLNPPSDEEHAYCVKANELKPDDLIAALDYALLIKESLWVKPAKVWIEKQELVLGCIEMFQNALRIAKQDGTISGCRFARKIKIYLAEFLLFGKDEDLAQDKGKALLDKCVEANPKSTIALHKAAKLHHRGAFGTRKYKDLEKAKEYYKRALETKFSNFPCLMDYMKLLRDIGDHRESIAAIDSFLESTRRDAYVVRLLIERGCLLWVFNPFESESFKRQACESWLRALVGFPDRAEDVYDIIKRPYMVVDEKKTYITKFLVIQTLEQMKKDFKDKAEMEAISAWLVELKKPRDDNGKSDKRTGRVDGGQNVYRPPHKRLDEDELADALKGLSVTEPSDWKEPPTTRQVPHRNIHRKK